LKRRIEDIESGINRYLVRRSRPPIRSAHRTPVQAGLAIFYFDIPGDLNRSDRYRGPGFDTSGEITLDIDA
jgi:hypothetical protein